jgi:hypothetical protein
MKRLPAHLVWLVGLAGVCLVVAGGCPGDPLILCEVLCDDGNECTITICDTAFDGNCLGSQPRTNGTACNSGNGTCQNGSCEPRDTSCDGIDCDDENECTADACSNGMCNHTALADGTSCNFGAGRCAGDTCESAPDEEACSAALPVAADGVELDVDVYAVFDTGPGGLSFDANGNLFAGNFGTAGAGDASPVLKVSPQGLITKLDEVEDPDVLIVDLTGLGATAAGNVLVGGVNSDGDGQITEMTPDGDIVPEGKIVDDVCLGNINHMMFDTRGRLVLTNFNAGSVCTIKDDVISTLIPQVQGGGQGATTIEDPNTTALYVTSENSIYEYDSDGALQNTEPFTTGSALAYGSSVPFDGLLVRRSGMLQARDLDTNEETHLLTGSIGGNVTFDANGNLYIADTGNRRILRVSPADTVDPSPACPAAPP